ncbi:hypothetical protein SISSUDRAFT_917238 [Sistotremastrum suecicum HHB10207 ss-3]|uniref:Uncharacterized protein n=1 Tax=Sistotremastrum suecicum HHB10207 ss-3 TaxID=1314776 RepID=A0A166BXW3_9AGAM|nr:hypothetical protein SISSUDRAFT_917238 [Sistotremastrum suecicum HHB10207 ss-3]
MDIVIQTTPLGDPATGNPFISSPRDGLLLLGYCCEVQLTERYLPLTDIVYAVILRTSGIFRLASGIALSEVNSMQEKVPVYKWHEWAQNEVAVLQSDNDEFSDGAYSVERVHGSRIVFGDFEWYTNDSDRHLATIYRQSDDAEETPIGPPAPISLGAHDFKLELDSKPAVRRLKIGMKVISAFTPSGEFYLDQNHILALEPNSHEPENCALGHEHESDSNRRKVKVWTMG